MASNDCNINKSVVGTVFNGSPKNVTIGHMNVNSIELLQELDFDLSEPIKIFKGRNQEYEQLENLFFNEDKTKIQNKVVICGIPGIGKSEFAIHFADKCQKAGKIKNIYRVKSENEEVLKKSWLLIKNIYKTSEKGNTLFILDNGVSRKIFRECDFKMPDDFFFIITSQIKDWGDDIVSIELSTLDTDAALGFYQMTLKEEYNCDLLKELANLVGCIPLGLQITAAGVREYKKICGKNCVQEYLKDLKKSRINIIVEGFPSSSDNSYEKSLYEALKMSLNKIEAETGPLKNSGTLYMLFICSYLDAETHVSATLIHILLYNKEYVHGGINVVDKSLITLDNYSLITFRDYHITMHRFTQKMIRYYFRTYYPDKEKEFYEMCLENSLISFDDISSNFCIYVLPQILQHSDANIEPIVINFLKKYKSEIQNVVVCKTFQAIFYSLVIWGRIESIKIIFNSPGFRAKDYIIKFNLIKIADKYNKLNIMELFQNYLGLDSTKNYKNIKNKLKRLIFN